MSKKNEKTKAVRSCQWAGHKERSGWMRTEACAAPAAKRTWSDAVERVELREREKESGESPNPMVL